MLKTIFDISNKDISIAGRKRIRDRGINWQESYHGKAAPLKKRYTKKIGPGSYYRWEGHDYTTDSDYFIVVGPAVQKYGDKAFFAGIKKLPPKHERKKIYAPSGKYFTSIIGALSFANRQWGTPFPENQADYNIDTIANIEIPRRVKG